MTARVYSAEPTETSVMERRPAGRSALFRSRPMIVPHVDATRSRNDISRTRQSCAAKKVPVPPVRRMRAPSRIHGHVQRRRSEPMNRATRVGLPGSALPKRAARFGGSGAAFAAGAVFAPLLSAPPALESDRRLRGRTLCTRPNDLLGPALHARASGQHAAIKSPRGNAIRPKTASSHDGRPCMQPERARLHARRRELPASQRAARAVA